MMSNKSLTQTKRRGIGAKIVLSLLLILSLSGFACQSSQETTTKNVAAPSPTPEEKVDDLQEILQTYETAGFKFIYVFRRFDGAAISAEDRDFLKSNRPIEINRWRLTRDDKTLVAGSNYKFPPKMLEVLKERFAFEDYSKPSPEGIEKNLNGEINRKTQGEK